MPCIGLVIFADLDHTVEYFGSVWLKPVKAFFHSCSVLPLTASWWCHWNRPQRQFQFHLPNTFLMPTESVSVCACIKKLRGHWPALCWHREGDSQPCTHTNSSCWSVLTASCLSDCIDSVPQPEAQVQRLQGHRRVGAGRPIALRALQEPTAGLQAPARPQHRPRRPQKRRRFIAASEWLQVIFFGHCAELFSSNAQLLWSK